MSSSERRLLGLGGLLFVVIVIAAIAVTGNSPDTNASPLKILTYYHQHKGNMLANAYLLELGVFVGLIFFWFLRELLIDSQADRRLANLGFAGVILFATGGALSGGIHLALWDSVNNVGVSTLQTLNVMQNDLASILTGVGQALFLIATGYALVTSGVLARWLGWVGVVLGVVSLALPFIGPLWAGVWVIIASIVILIGAGSGAPTQGTLGSQAGAT
jgi:hypothetical protein